MPLPNTPRNQRTSMTRPHFRNCLAALLLLCAGTATSLDLLAVGGEHWIATWGTAQQLTATNAQGGPGGRTNVPPAPSWRGAWSDADRDIAECPGAAASRPAKRAAGQRRRLAPRSAHPGHTCRRRSRTRRSG